MNTKLFRNSIEKCSFFVMTLFAGILAFAQEKLPEVNVSTTTTKTTTEEWYANPTYIIIGAALFIALIVLIVRSGGRKD